LELRVPAIAAAVPQLRESVRRFAIMAGIPNTDDVALAVSEAATNAIVHAYNDRDRGDVHIVACDEPERLVLTVRDYGGGIQPRVDSPGLGIGLPLIATLASMMSVEQPLDGGTLVRMRFEKALAQP
jgi:anti-sigma regulatory factor (Ser/Thr protein kinase)